MDVDLYEFGVLDDVSDLSGVMLDLVFEELDVPKLLVLIAVVLYVMFGFPAFSLVAVLSQTSGLTPHSSSL